MIKALIFDYFGVITNDNFWQSEAAIKDESKYLNLSNRTNLGRMHWQEYLLRIAEMSGRTLHAIEDSYQDQNINPQVGALIKQLKRQGYKTGLLSNAHHEYLQPVLKQTGLDKMFDEVIISSAVGLIKPDSRIYQLALNKLDCAPSETVFIDDQSINIDAANKLGINGILFKDLKTLIKQLNSLDIL